MSKGKNHKKMAKQKPLKTLKEKRKAKEKRKITRNPSSLLNKFNVESGLPLKPDEDVVQ